MKSKVALGAIAALALSAGPVFAQQFVYTPINPTFGGNPFNSAHLLGLANAQNLHEHVDPPTPELTQGELFAQELQSQLLSALAVQVTDAIFGDNPQPSGTVSFGGQTINFTRGLGEVTVTISSATGGDTVIKVPTFVTASGQ